MIPTLVRSACVGLALVGAVCVAIAPGSPAFASAPTDPGSDAPDPGPRRILAGDLPASYADAIAKWRSPAQVNDWIGARFEYDRARALQLSESQRQAGLSLPIHDPDRFYREPAGVCVDLARFAVETLRATVPSAKASYLMIEFDPAVIAGHMLRRHWVAQYEVDGHLFYFADSKRPGHVAGPYRSAEQYIAEYADYRQRRIVSYRVVPSFERQTRKLASKAGREQRSLGD